MGVPGLRIASSAGETMLYSRDQSEIPPFLKELMFRSRPDAVAQPRSTEALSAVLRFASSRGISVIPRGSGSSPFGGSVPVDGGLVVDLSCMDKILEIDEARRIARVQGGVRWADLDHELRKRGLTLNTTPSSKFSTVAGWIATGGLGLNSLSRGHLSRSVLEVELVTPSGEVRRLTPEDTHFGALFGSEGQLGVIAAVTLSVRELPAYSRPHLLFFPDARSALGFAEALARSAVRPAHIAYESASKFTLVNRLLDGRHFREEDAVLVSVEGRDSERAFQEFLRSAGLSEEKEYLARYMWNERFFPMKVRTLGPGMLGSEVVAPLSRLVEVVSGASELSARLDIEPLFEVHFVGDDQALVLCYYLTDQGNTIRYTIDALKSFLLTSHMLDLGARPYSVGVWNHAFSSAEERTKAQALREAKAALDPSGIMNSGKYFSLGGRFGGLLAQAFRPSLMRPVLKSMRLFIPITARGMRAASGFAARRLRPKMRTELLRTADECAMCGACVGVCPAYLVLGDERVTARGKLVAVKAMARGERLTKEHSDRIFLCMRCKACEQVCQSKLALVDAFELLERELERVHGRDAQEIERFVRYAEALPEYDKLIERGLVLGAPKHGMGGGSGDV